MPKEELKFGAPPAKAGDQSPALTYMADKAARDSPSARTARELEMWHTWNNNGRKPEHLEPLLKAYEPIFAQKVRQWSAGAAGVNPAFMLAQVQKHWINAVHTFEPDRGYALATHVDKPMNKAQRARNTVQNAGYVSEETARTIAPIQNATAELHAELGRMPTVQEIAARAGLGVGAVKRHQKEVRKDVAASSYENDPTENPMNRAHDIAPLLREQFQQPGFQPHVLDVFDHTFGLNGAPTNLSGGQLAKKLGVSPSAISQAKSLILAETKKYL